MRRLNHWDTELFHHFLIERSNHPFKYGAQDCSSFAADGIKAITGVDIAEDFRGYKTEKGALRAIKKVTAGTTVEHAAEYCADKYGLEEVPPLMAQRGDLALVDVDGPSMALVHLNGRDVVMPGETGLRLLPLTSIRRAWRV